MWSKDPSTKAGCVIVRPDRTIASVGYNGFPRGMKDSIDRLLNREDKYDRIIHAEMNAIMSSHERLEGNTLYVWPFLTCPRCAVHAAQSGIKRIVAPECPTDKAERWSHQFDKTRDYMKEVSVEVQEYAQELFT